MREWLWTFAAMIGGLFVLVIGIMLVGLTHDNTMPEDYTGPSVAEMGCTG